MKTTPASKTTTLILLGPGAVAAGTQAHRPEGV